VGNRAQSKIGAKDIPEDFRAGLESDISILDEYEA
jgi:hypothetical protein